MATTHPTEMKLTFNARCYLERGDNVVFSNVTISDIIQSNY